MSWIHEKPKTEKSWIDVLNNGVVYPHPEATKSQLQDWIVTHASLLDTMRDLYFQLVADDQQGVIDRLGAITRALEIRLGYDIPIGEEVNK